MTLLVLLVLVLFTRPDGSPVYVNPEQVASVSPGTPTQCEGQTLIKTTASFGDVCVTEKLLDVVGRLSVHVTSRDYLKRTEREHDRG